ncbi:hypothetical protein [Nostoc sp. DSM 114167]|uniref:hypothetical protein n=1 Tax=Nostoc sp. DSM 114167 TaxID=3439050 RepID=UPI00404542DB
MNRNCDRTSQFPVLLVSSSKKQKCFFTSIGNAIASSDSFDKLELMGCDAYGGLHLSIGGANTFGHLLHVIALSCSGL